MRKYSPISVCFSHGAQEVGMDEAQSDKTKRRSKPVFRGAGYRLGETAEEQSEMVTGEAQRPEPVSNRRITEKFV